jgi:hypothetical protein
MTGATAMDIGSLREFLTLPMGRQEDLLQWIGEKVKARERWNHMLSADVLRQRYHVGKKVGVTLEAFKGAMIASGHLPSSPIIPNPVYKITALYKAGPK